MAVTRSTYSLAINYNTAQSASDLAALYRQAFIDAGLMDEWYDSWSVSNNQSSLTYFRVLKLVQDSGKTYGNTYILLSFVHASSVNTIRVYLSLSTGGWDTSAHAPTGTQYLDYHTAPHTGYGPDGVPMTYIEYDSAKTSFSLVRYTSGSSSIFITPNGHANPLIIQSSIGTQPSWVDLDRVFVPPVFMVTGTAHTDSDGWRMLLFSWPYQLRRMVFPGRTPAGTGSTFFKAALTANIYTYCGYRTSDDSNDPSGSTTNYIGAIRLPWSDGQYLMGYSSPWCPICKSVEMALPLNLKLPSDFCIASIPNKSVTAGLLSRLTIAENEVWEVVVKVSTPNIANTMALMARVN